MARRSSGRKKKPRRIIGYQGIGRATVISGTIAGVHKTSRRAMKSSQKMRRGGRGIDAAFIGIQDKNIKPIYGKD